MDCDRIAGLTAECETLESSLSASNIIVEDGSRISDVNPYQAAHAHLDAAVVVRHLKATLNKLIYGLFRRAPGAQASSEPLRVRWIDATFPFTSPSYEVEVLYMGKWLELLGCGVVNQSTMQRAGALNVAIVLGIWLLTVIGDVGHPQKAGWAFGLGLERIAMVLFRIPDIRLFWTTDARFLDQYRTGRIVPFVPFSKNPATYKDVSFWLPEAGFHENDFCEVVREAGGLLVEEVKLASRFACSRVLARLTCLRLCRSTDSCILAPIGSRVATGSRTGPWTGASLPSGQTAQPTDALQYAVQHRRQRPARGRSSVLGRPNACRAPLTSRSAALRAAQHGDRTSRRGRSAAASNCSSASPRCP